MEVEAYLGRLGIDSPVEPTTSGLELLERRHLLKVPFENLDIDRGVPIVLEEDGLLQKIVIARRGGFCYELTDRGVKRESAIADRAAWLHALKQHFDVVLEDRC